MEQEASPGSDIDVRVTLEWFYWSVFFLLDSMDQENTAYIYERKTVCLG